MDQLSEIYQESLLEEEVSVPAPRKKEKQETRTFTSERQYFIQLTADMLQVPFTVVLWKTINWPTPWLQENYSYCMKEGKPPARLWNYLYKKSKHDLS